MRAALGPGLRAHWPMAVVVGVAAVARALVAIAYAPALFFSDSWSYVALAFGSGHFAPDRPSGYPLLMNALSVLGRNLTEITTLQHLAGVATGVLVYALLLRLGLARWAATLVAAVVLLDGYAITLEQTIVAEAFFTVALVASAWLVSRRPLGPAAAAGAGVLLAAAVTLRTAAVFAIPVWIVYLLWRRPGRAAAAAGVLAVVLPLLAYAAVYDAKTGHFGITAADGWFLYGRVGSIADCSKFDPPADTRFLCEPPGADERRGALYYVWDVSSPARQRYGGLDAPGSNALLKRFAWSVIAGRPGAYAKLVGGDLLRFFEPGVASRGTSDNAINLPDRPRAGPPYLRTDVRDSYFPSFEPRVRAPAAVARRYQRLVHVPRPLIGLLALASLLALAAWRLPIPHRREILLLTGMGLAMLVGAAFTSSFVLRYLLPALPLIAAGGALAVADLAAAFSRRRAGRPTPPPAAPPATG
jgi:hypothetical protein